MVWKLGLLIVKVSPGLYILYTALEIGAFLVDKSVDTSLVGVAKSSMKSMAVVTSVFASLTLGILSQH
jgi:hypothetical protein